MHPRVSDNGIEMLDELTIVLELDSGMCMCLN